MMPPSMEGGGAVGRMGDGAVDAAAKGGFDVQSLIDPSTDATTSVS